MRAREDSRLTAIIGEPHERGQLSGRFGGGDEVSLPKSGGWGVGFPVFGGVWAGGFWEFPKEMAVSGLVWGLQ